MRFCCISVSALARSLIASSRAFNTCSRASSRCRLNSSTCFCISDAICICCSTKPCMPKEIGCRGIGGAPTGGERVGLALFHQVAAVFAAVLRTALYAANSSGDSPMPNSACVGDCAAGRLILGASVSWPVLGRRARWERGSLRTLSRDFRISALVSCSASCDLATSSPDSRSLSRVRRRSRRRSFSSAAGAGLLCTSCSTWQRSFNLRASASRAASCFSISR
mmetsp:Transcript_4530/g.7620  ORF Transcript_4530/g.7620 Transcript_4530/m.7620 type:complete len:223 (-) Transcript_4530:31-699(-)